MAGPSQRAVFTIIPNGIENGRARLNLHIAPRLSLPAGTVPDTLEQFPDWRDWADTINAATVILRVNGVPVEIVRAKDANPTIWSALLPPETKVRTHVFQDLRGAGILTYPLAALAEAIERDYVDMAAQDGEALPAVRDLVKKNIDYRPSRRRDRKALIKLLQANQEPNAVSRRDVAMALLAEYHRPLNEGEIVTAKKQDADDPHEDAKYRAHPRVAMPDAAALADSFDFHRIVAAIGQHPALMRACGLVVPLNVDAGDIPGGNVELQVEMDWAASDVETEPDICPRTQARRSGDDFRARPRTASSFSGGWLRLPPAKYRLLAMDVDGAGLSLKNFSINLPNIGDERFDDESFNVDRVPRTGMPRLRTAGLQLAHVRRDQAIAALFKGSGELNDAAMAGDDPKLFAEDLIRGWRADVEDDAGGLWQSLLRFDGSYALTNNGATIETEDEEAILRLAAGKSPDGKDPDILKATEAVFAWSGWSLAAPQPALVVMPDDKSHAEAPNTVPDGLPLQASAKARRGSLPLLRFGRNYRVRMRYADLAGGGLAWTPDDLAPLQAVSKPYYFGRYEPVEAPALTLILGEKLPSDGETMARGALRTMDIAADNDLEVRRNIVPPRVGIRFAEMHGVLDKDGRPDPAAYALLTGRDRDYRSVTVTSFGFNPAKPAKRGAAVKTDYAIARPAHWTPYLYDPLGAGCALRIAGVPGISPDKIWSVPFVGDSWDAGDPSGWPDALGFSLLAVETGTTGWDPVERVFTIVLKQGERARVRVSALVPNRDLLKFKLLDRLRERAEADPALKPRYVKVRNQIRRGQHWMFTPWRMVELVHALQRPLVEPAFLALGAGRPRGDVAASIDYTTPIHCKSTVRIDTGARWIEIDDHGPSGPVLVPRRADAFSRPFARLDHPEGVAKRLTDKHVFEDTRARWVGYKMRATTRFREYMPPEIRADPDLLVRDSDEARIWVPASSPPAAPSVRYVVPTFGWFESGGPGGEKRSWRDGGGLRVYLDRPWFTSGSNEMLAVLLARGEAEPAVGPFKDFSTLWGRDPAWAGPKVSTVAPVRSAFPRRVDQAPVPCDFGDPAGPPDLADGAKAGSGWRLTNLKPQGAPAGIAVDAVPHAVGYDPVRGLWYADIVVNPGNAYFPFLRMALARYQPHAIPGCELSSAVVASFQQLSPDRIATVVPIPLFLNLGRKVSVYGRLPVGGRAMPRAGNVEIRLQRLKPGGDEDLDWRDTPQGSPPATPPPGLGIADVRRSSGAFKVSRSALSARQRVMLREGVKLFEAGRMAEILDQPDLFELMLPPLIHEETLILPTRGDDRLRLLITESERFDTEDAGGVRLGEPSERIVYAAAIEV